MVFSGVNSLIENRNQKIYNSMKLFKEFFESKQNMRDKIIKIIRQVQTLQDDPESTDLFAKKTNKCIMLDFFNRILSLLPDEELEQRMKDIDGYGSVEELFRSFNSGGHPVRDFLILAKPTV